MKAPQGVDLLFDARHIQQSGIGTYIGNLLPHLESRFNERGLSLAVLVDRDTQPSLQDSTAVAYAEPQDARMYGSAEQKAWDNAVSATRPRAMWVPHYPFPLTLLRKRNWPILTFVTVHDTLHLHDHSISGMGRARQIYARAMLNLDVRRCRRIFTPSQATATSLVEKISASSRSQVMVTPIPLDDVWFTPADLSLSPISPKYVLYVGNSKHHKNLPMLLEAYAMIADAVPQNLVIAGSGLSLRASDERVDELAAQNAERVQILGRLDFDALRALIAGADLLVMPSLFEGAGLPPLEAMASGTAVLASAIPSLRETCGPGADYFDPYNRDELAALLRRHLNDDDARAGLSARGWDHVSTRQSQIEFGSAVEAICAEIENSLK